MQGNHDHESTTKKLIKRDKFLPREDQKIIKLVNEHGTQWKKIAQLFGPTRTIRQIRERWQNYLNPDYISKFTPDEDEQLSNLYEQIGPRWSKIAAMIGNKSAILCRNRYRVITKMKRKEGSFEISNDDPPLTMFDETFFHMTFPDDEQDFVYDFELSATDFDFC